MGKKLGQRVGFNTVSHKNSLSFGIGIGFKFSKLPWTYEQNKGTGATRKVLLSRLRTPTLKEKPLVLFFVNPFLQNHWFLNQH
jgi:hypothetical protein